MNEQHYTFAQFWKCALQVNPHAYSANYRGTDSPRRSRSWVLRTTVAWLMQRPYERC